MRLALIVIYFFFISTAGLTAQSAVSGGTLCGDINSLYGWDNPAIFNNDGRNTLQTTMDSHSVTANGCLFDDCLFTAQPEKALLTYDHGGTKRLDYFDDKWIHLAGTGYHTIYTRFEISAMDSGRDGELANNPGPSKHSYYNEVVNWIKDAYHAWVAKNQYDSTRLLLLCFGLVGLIGIRRKLKKN